MSKFASFVTRMYSSRVGEDCIISSFITAAPTLFADFSDPHLVVAELLKIRYFGVPAVPSE
jgi:hypothetical protein